MSGRSGRGREGGETICYPRGNRPGTSCFESHRESEAKCKGFQSHVKITFVCITRQNNSEMAYWPRKVQHYLTN